ncbi:MAG: hypothetical protein MPJ50_16700 [Pirellulales bacterium]|nr:hypothetical protein [Pirellulales bacterium]
MKKDGHPSAGIPFVIGVTGHRELPLEDLDKIKSVLRDLFAEVQSLLPETPLRVLSPLAEGADRLVAEIALELGVELVAVLPFPAADYEQDFGSPESTDEFRRLVQNSVGVVTIPPHSDAKQAPQTSDPRAIQYALTGAFVAEHSQLMIALWDGEYTGKLGGTWQVVDFVRHGIPVSLRAHGDQLSQEELGDVARVPVDRTTSGKAITLEFLVDNQEEPVALKDAPTMALARRNLNTFNLKSKALSRESRASECIESKQISQGGATCDIREQFVIADALAIRMQRIYLRAWAAVLYLSFTAAITLQIHLNAVSGWLLSVAYGAIIVVAFSVYYGIKLFRVEERYLDYRALAEGLRVQTHWLAAGMHNPVCQFYLHRQHSELRWIRTAIRNATFKATSLDSNPDDRASFDVRVSAISTNWLQEQLSYFTHAAQKAVRAERRWTWAARIMLGVGVILAAIKSSLGHSPWLVVLVAAPTILVAIFTLHLQNRKFGPLAQQASRMASLFKCALKRLKELQATSKPMNLELEQLLQQLGREVLAENAEWVTLHRDRPISTPFVA